MVFQYTSKLNCKPIITISEKGERVPYVLRAYLIAASQPQTLSNEVLQSVQLLFNFKAVVATHAATVLFQLLARQHPP